MNDKVISREEVLRLFDEYGETPICRTTNTKWGLPVDELNVEIWGKIRYFINQPITLDSNVEEAIELISGLQMFELCNIGMGRLKKINQALNTFKQG